MITDKVNKILSESPDRVRFKDHSLEHDDDDAYPFTLHDGKFYFSRQGSAHYNMVYNPGELNDKWISLNKKYAKKLKDDDFEVEARDFLDYPGRVWCKHKIITFWKYPDISDFRKVVDGLNNSLPKRGLGHVDSSWFVEVYPDKKELDDMHWDMSGVLIPIDEYKADGLKVLKDIDKMHVMSPDKKKKALEKTGAKSKASSIQLPKNMTLAQYNSLIHQESFNYLPKFKDFYLDE